MTLSADEWRRLRQIKIRMDDIARGDDGTGEADLKFTASALSDVMFLLALVKRLAGGK